jgi:hypothetical protein
MIKAALLPCLLVLAGCITSEVRPEVEAVRDLIRLEQPDQVDQIRVLNQLHYQYVNDHYVSVTQGSRHYLVEFTSRCRALRRGEYTPAMVDTRRDAKHISARWDTIRGCPIDRIYAVSAGQLLEIKQMHDRSLATGR